MSVVWKGLVAGLAGGLVGAAVMSGFQALVPASAFRRLLGEPEPEDGQGEPATVQTAEAIAESVFSRELTEQEKGKAGPAVHYAFGASVGGAYGALAEHLPAATAGFGLPYGAAVWLVADEAGVPAAGLSGPPWEHPPSTHLYALASHLVYGLTLELARRTVRSLL